MPFQLRTSRLRSWTPCADFSLNSESSCMVDGLTAEPQIPNEFRTSPISGLISSPEDTPFTTRCHHLQKHQKTGGGSSLPLAVLCTIQSSLAYKRGGHARCCSTRTDTSVISRAMSFPASTMWHLAARDSQHPGGPRRHRHKAMSGIGEPGPCRSALVMVLSSKRNCAGAST